MVDSPLVAAKAPSRLVPLAIKALSCLPLKVRSRLGRALGGAVALVPTRDRRVAELQVSYFLPGSDAKRIVRRVYGSVAQTALEALDLAPLVDPAAARIRCEGTDRIPEWKGRRRAILALTAHLGNWDLLGAYFASAGLEIVAVGREARSPTLQPILEALRRQSGIETIWRSDSMGMRALVSAFKREAVIAALIDQDTRVTSEIVPFFGVSAKTPSTLVDLAKRYDATIVTAFSVRNPDGTYRFIVEEIEDKSDTKRVLEKYNERLERLVREYPDQWVWFHKRWRTQTPEKTMSSREYLEWLGSRLRGGGSSSAGA